MQKPPVQLLEFLYTMEHQWYIKLYRKLLENPISYNIELLWFLSYLLLEVNHTEQEIYKWNQKIKLNPWERIVSQRQLAERFWVSISKIHRFIKILEDENILEHEWNNNFTIVKLLNWDSYNWSETRKERQKKTNETPTETKQEWKECNNIFTDFINNPENESATFYLIKNFLSLGWKPTKDETVETIRNWMKEVFEENQVTESNIMKRSIDIWYEYWKEEKKPKNIKSTFRSTIKFSIPWKKL